MRQANNHYRISSIITHNVLFSCLAALLIVLPMPSPADEVHVAVASNFSTTAKRISAHFEKETGHTLSLSFGSTGKQYAQIINGAPFDVFLAADTVRPVLLEEKGLATERFTYALGQLVIWAAKQPVDAPIIDKLTHKTTRHVSMANPRFAPYGRAAQQVLESLNMWSILQPKLVRGENISQAYQFVASNNAEFGFVALSQVKGRVEPTDYWLIPSKLYEPIEQQAVLLNERSVSKEFLQFIQSNSMRQLIQESGYKVP